MFKAYFLCAAMPLLGSGGCTPQPAPEGPAHTAPPARPQTTVLDPLTQDLDRAAHVQVTVDQNAESARKALDAQERGESSP